MGEIKWIKLAISMFDDEKIKLIDAMPEHDTIFYIWIRLLIQAGKTNAGGYIFLTENIPYTDEMLSTIFNRPLNSIRLALKTFEEFGMIQKNGKGFLKVTNWEKHQNVEGMEKVREQTRERVARYRGKRKMLEENNESNVTSRYSNGTEEERRKKREDIDIEEDIDIDIDKDIKKEDISISWEKIKTVWNSLPNPVKPVRAITDRRKEKIRARMNSLDLTQRDIIAAINNIKKSSFLQGKNSRGWTIDIDWLFRDDTRFLKVLEGKYMDEKPQEESRGNQNFDFTDFPTTDRR